jgi:hypothetical protein
MAKEKAHLFPGVPRMYLALNRTLVTPSTIWVAEGLHLGARAACPMAVAQEFEADHRRRQGGRGLRPHRMFAVTHANPLVGARKVGFIGTAAARHRP